MEPAVVPTAMERHPGDRMGRYALVERLGSGGMAEVWKALDSELGRQVALKLLHPQARSDAARKRLRREAQAMARLNHPNVVTVHDVGSDGPTDFIAMELARCTMREWLREPRDWRETVRVVVAASRGLAAAHRVGVVHRDVKPDNILIATTGEVKVSDFGIAGEPEPSPTGVPLDPLVTDERIAGTPAYIAPEHLLGRPLDARADQFGLAVTAWEALSGQLPFVTAPADGVPTIARHLAVVTRADPVVGPAGLPPAVAQVLRRGLAVDPAARFDDVEQFAAALERAASRQRRWLVVAAIAGLAIAIAIAVGVLASGTDDGRAVYKAVATRPLGAPFDDGSQPVLAFARAGNHVAIFRHDQTELAISSLDGRTVATHTLPRGLTIESAALDDAGRELAISGLKDTTWEIWRTRAPARELVRVGAVPASHDHVLRVQNSPSMAFVGDDLVVSQGDENVWRIAPGRDMRTIAKVGRADEVRARPGSRDVTVLDLADGKYHLRMLDLEGRTLQVISDLPHWDANSFDWIDHDRLLFIHRHEYSKLSEVSVGPSGVRGHRELGKLGASVWELHAAGDRAIAIASTREFGAYTLSLDANSSLVRLENGGWTGRGLLPLEDGIVLAGDRFDRRALVSLSPSTPARVLVWDVDGMPFRTFDGKFAVVGDYNSKYCGLRVYDGARIVASREIVCERDVFAFCATATHGRCLVSMVDGTARVYHALDPMTLAIGGVVYTDADVGHTMPAMSALSPDGNSLVIPRPTGSISWVTLADGARRDIAAPRAKTSWIVAGFIDDETVVLSGVGQNLRGRLDVVTRDGRVRPLLENDRGYFINIARHGPRSAALVRNVPIMHPIMIELR